MLFFDVYKQTAVNESINPEQIRLYIPEEFWECEDLDITKCYFKKVQIQCPYTAHVGCCYKKILKGE
jgi:hypothetical protein